MLNLKIDKTTIEKQIKEMIKLSYNSFALYLEDKMTKVIFLEKELNFLRRFLNAKQALLRAEQAVVGEYKNNHSAIVLSKIYLQKAAKRITALEKEIDAWRQLFFDKRKLFKECKKELIEYSNYIENNKQNKG